MDALSFWGWGRADGFPDVDTRRQLGQQLQLFLGLDAPLEPTAPPELAAVTIADPRVLPPPALASFCSSEREPRIRHTHGRGYPDLVRGFRGEFEPAPDFVARPRDEAELAALLAWAAGEGVAVIPRGGGTSVVGGIAADVGPGFRGVASLSLAAFDRVLEVDALSLAARIQAGATGPAIDAQLADHGLTLRHYPQSYEFATLGGFLATRSGGHYATLHTHIDDFVESIRMITPQGPLESRRLPGSGAGPSPDRLMLGSEGILGVITEAWMRVQRRPRWRSSASVRFEQFDDAVATTRALAQSGLYPSNCRLLDRREALLSGVGAGDRDLVLVGFESADHDTGGAMARALEIARERGGDVKDERHRDGGERTSGDGDAGAWRSAFFRAPYLQSALVSLGVVIDTFETACTWDLFPALHEAVITRVRAVIREVTGRKGYVSCRFTHVYPDGPAPYYTFVGVGRRGAELEQWAAIKRAACDALLEHGATITHHHAVGRTHRPWYEQQRPELFAAALRSAKRALDPAGVMNPGVLLAPDQSAQ